MALPSEQPHEAAAPDAALDEPVALDGEFEAEAVEPTSLPIPSGPLRSQFVGASGEQKRPSFWKRIKMRTRAAANVESASVGDMAVRLDAIEKTIDHFDTTLQTQLDALNARLDEVWESEEQLSHLADIQDKLDRLAAAQIEQGKTIESLQQSPSWIPAVVAVAAAALGFVAGLFF